MTSVFSIQETSPDPKLYVSTGVLPGFVDPQHLPTKKAPWRQISNTPFVRAVSVVLPEETYQRVWNKIEQRMSTRPKYAKVILKLEQLLEGEFFTEYVKRGNVLMLSEGQSRVDSVFSLHEGVLRLYLNKESYERAGLQGKPIPSGGRKHVKTRYLVEFDLRQPSMLHGKKGFERIIWAAKNVLNQSLVWLFRDLEQDLENQSRPIFQHHPTICESSTSADIVDDVLIPSIFRQPASSSKVSLLHDDQEAIYEIGEWLDLVVLRSPRVTMSDNVDPYISRYTLNEGDKSAKAMQLRVLEWTGLLESLWLGRLMVEIIRESRITPSQSWLAISVSSHHTESIGTADGYQILLQPGTWLDQGGTLDYGSSSAPSSPPETTNEGFQHFVCLEFVDSIP